MIKIEHIYKKLRHQMVELVLWGYRNFFIPYLSYRLRKKEQIKILFVLTSLGSWKTETLFREMLNNERFNPHILLLKGTYFEDDRPRLRNYCNTKGYPYSEIDENKETLQQKFKPDIIIYQKQYNREYPNHLEFKFNLRSLFIFAPYGIRNTNESWSWDTPMLRNAWQIYYENKSIYNEYTRQKKVYRKNGRLTGTPFLDNLMVPKESIKDPWIKSKSRKFRIIYAPHHSFEPGSPFDTGTFLQLGEQILELAKSYSGKIQWAFKPHPVFRRKLEQYWQKEKVDKYFAAWEELGQVEEGEYMGLFKHSDAMIHDCGSFIAEYLSTGNPVLYIDKPGSRTQGTFNSTFTAAIGLHYHASDIKQIEKFIIDIMEGRDIKKVERNTFQQEYLIPPFGHSACHNIIECIIDPNTDKKMHVH